MSGGHTPPSHWLTKLVAAYAIKYKKTNLRDAFTMVQGARNYARPNLTLFQHLVQYEKECLGTNSVEMVQVTTDFEETKQIESNKAGGKKRKLRSNNELITVPNFYKKQVSIIKYVNPFLLLSL